MAGMKSMISVVIPTYNRANTIRRALDSVTNQTYKNWECLVVDDGSTDNTKDQVAELARNDERIIWLERSKGRQKGANACRNIGAEKAKGQYVAFLDSDDYYHSNHLENKLNEIEESHVDGLFGSIQVKEGDKIIPKISRSLQPGEKMINYVLGTGVAQTSSLFFTRESICSVKWDETILRHQDIDLCCRYHHKFRFVPSEGITVTVDRTDYFKKRIDYASTRTVIEKYRTDLDAVVYAEYCNYMFREAISTGAEKKHVSYYRRERFINIGDLAFKKFLTFRQVKRTYNVPFFLLKYFCLLLVYLLGKSFRIDRA